MDDIGREFDSLTSAATRGVVVPPPDEVRRRARQARRQGIGAGLGSLAVVAIAVAALWPRGNSAMPSPPVAQPSTPSATAELPHTQPTRVPSGTFTPTPQPPPSLHESSLLLTADDLGDGWTVQRPGPRVNEVRFDPCGDGKLGPKPESQKVRRFTSDSGEVVEHLMGHHPADAKAAMRALRDAVERCGGGKVSHVDRGPLSAGDDSLVLRQQGGEEDPITTFVTVVRAGGLVMSMQDTRAGEPYSEKSHRALAEKAAARLLR